MLTITNSSIVYLHAPAGVATGGVELLHQLAYSLRNMGISSFIVLYGNNEHRIHSEYKKYNLLNIEEAEIVDSPNNVEIYTEVMARQLLNNNRNSQKVMWWLSVDNFYPPHYSGIHIRDIFIRNKEDGFAFFRYRLKRFILGQGNDFSNNIGVGNFINKDITFAYQCEYIKQHLSKFGARNLVPLSDYINIEFDKLGNVEEKEDIILYNPAKGYEFTEQLIKSSPDLRWTPIIGLNRDQLILLLHKSKLYIDFGNHPGKDRLPRECAIQNCCIITGKRGAAAYESDIPIAEKYKFDENKEKIEDILKKIRFVLNNYASCIDDFAIYRSKIREEKAIFDTEVSALFSPTN